jgi:hypothetical protein
MAPKIRRSFRHALFYAALLLMGSVVIESDIIMGHHEADHLHQARVHYIEEPIEEEDNEENELSQP